VNLGVTATFIVNVEGNTTNTGAHCDPQRTARSQRDRATISRRVPSTADASARHPRSARAHRTRAPNITVDTRATDAERHFFAWGWGVASRFHTTWLRSRWPSPVDLMP
jgi:hypothetical protein